MNSSGGRDQWLRHDPEGRPPLPGGYMVAGNDKRRATGEPRVRTKASPERPFDIWLQKQLHAMYDEIASEPLPTDLLGLIDRDAAKAGQKKEAAKGAASRKK